MIFIGQVKQWDAHALMTGRGRFGGSGYFIRILRWDDFSQREATKHNTPIMTLIRPTAPINPHEAHRHVVMAKRYPPILRSEKTAGVPRRPGPEYGSVRN